MGPKSSANKKKKNSRSSTTEPASGNIGSITQTERESIVPDDGMEDLYADPPGQDDPGQPVEENESNQGAGDITTRAEPGDMSQLELFEFEEIGGMATRSFIERHRERGKTPPLDRASDSSNTQVTPEAQTREEVIKREMPISDIERQLRNRIQNNDQRSDLYTAMLERLQSFQHEVNRITERQNDVYDTIFDILEEAGEFEHIEPNHTSNRASTGRPSEYPSTTRATRASETESISSLPQMRRNNNDRVVSSRAYGRVLETVEEREDEAAPTSRTSYGPDSDTRLRGAGLSSSNHTAYVGARDGSTRAYSGGTGMFPVRNSSAPVEARNVSEEIPLLREEPPHFDRSASAGNHRSSEHVEQRSTANGSYGMAYQDRRATIDRSNLSSNDPRVVARRGTSSSRSHHSYHGSHYGGGPSGGGPPGGGSPSGGPPGGPPGGGPPNGGRRPHGSEPGSSGYNERQEDGRRRRIPEGGPPEDPPDGDESPDDDDFDDEDSRSSHRRESHRPSPGDRRPTMRSPTPYNGPNPPHGFYQPPRYLARFDERNYREQSSTEWIRKAVRDKLATPANELPALKGLKLQPPELYSGKDDIEVFSNWIAQLFRWMRLAGLSGPDMDRSRVDVLGQMLSGEAQQWYNSVVDNPNSLSVLWDFENALIALYTRFVHHSTTLTATDKFDNVKYSKNGGAVQLANELALYGSRMVVTPDEYTIKRRFWGALPDELIHIIGRLRGMSAERTPLDQLVAEAAGIEDSIRADQINRRSRPNHSTASNSTPHPTPVASGSGRNSNPRPGNGNRDPKRSGSNGRFRPRVSDRRNERSHDKGPTRVSGGSHEHPTPKASGSGQEHRPPKHNHPKGSCFQCGSMDHWAKDCPHGDQKNGPAVRVMDEFRETESSTEQEPTTGREHEEGEEYDENPEGSQYDPEDDLPEEIYEDYSDQDQGSAWMGGMRDLDYHSDTEETGERLHSMVEETGETDEPTEDWFIGVAPPETRVAYELELEHQRSLMWATQYENRSLHQSVQQLSKENARLVEVNNIWARHLEECRVELRRMAIAIRTGASSGELNQMVQASTANQHRRMTEREQAVCSVYPDEESEGEGDEIPDLVTIPETPPDSPGGPTIHNVWMTDPTQQEDGIEGMAADQDTEDSTEEVLNAMSDPVQQREYRTTITPKEVRPQRMFRCMTAYVVVNGMKGLALLDSGSSIDCVSPEFARVAKLPVFPLDKPVGLQLGCVGSRSSINFGVREKVVFGGHSEEVYLDVVNVDHYDLVLGVPFLRQFKLCLNFEDETVVIGQQVIPSLKKGEEVRTARPTRRASTGTAAKYQWAEKDQYEGTKPIRRASTGSPANFAKAKVGKTE